MLHVERPSKASDRDHSTYSGADLACRGALPSIHHLAGPAGQAGRWPYFDSSLMGNLASCFGAGTAFQMIARADSNMHVQNKYMYCSLQCLRADWLWHSATCAVQSLTAHPAQFMSAICCCRKAAAGQQRERGPSGGEQRGAS